MTSKSPVRSCEDVDEAALSYAEIKALCAGDPRIRERMELDVDVSKLKIMKSAHQSRKFQMEDQLLKYFPEQIAQYQGYVKGLEADMKTLAEHPHPMVERPVPAKDTKPDTETVPADVPTPVTAEEHDAPTELVQGFAGMVVNGETFTDKHEAGKAVREAMIATDIGETVEIGSYRGLTMIVDASGFRRDLVLKGGMTHRTLQGVDNPSSFIIRIDSTLDGIPERLEAVKAHLENLYEQQKAAKAEVCKSFPREDELKEKSARLAKLDVLLNIGSRPYEEVIARSTRPSVLESLNRSRPPREKSGNKPKRSQQER